MTTFIPVRLFRRQPGTSHQVLMGVSQGLRGHPEGLAGVAKSVGNMGEARAAVKSPPMSGALRVRPDCLGRRQSAPVDKSPSGAAAGRWGR